MTSPVRILHLDDNPLDAQLVALTLEVEQEKLSTTLKYVQTKKEFLAALALKDFDIILSDYRMPGYDGDAALASAQLICPEIPFIMVTGELGEEFAVDRLQRGATDYVLKDRVFRLIPAIKRALAEAENQKKRREAERESHKRQGELWAIIQAMHAGVMVFDTKGDVVLVNDSLVSTLGFENVSEVQCNIAQFESMFELSDLEGKLLPVEQWPPNRIMRGETLDNVELKGRRKDSGQEWFFAFSGQPVWDESENQILAVVVARDITSRRKSEEELQEAQRTTRDILESIRDPFYSVDSHWRFTYLNTKCEEFLGKTREELLGRVLWDAFPNIAGSGAELMLREVMSRGTPLFYETESVIRGIWVDVHIFPKADGGVSVLYSDISERKAQEEALRLSEERLRLALEVADLGTFDLDVTTGIAVHSARHDQCFGYTEPVAEWTFEIATRHILPEDLPVVFEAHARAEATGTLDFEARVLWPDNSIHWIAPRGKMKYDSAGRPVRLLGVVADITERKAQEQAIRSSEDRFRAVFRDSPYPLALSRVRDGVFTDANDAYLAFLGVTREELIGHSSFELGLFSDPSERTDLVKKLEETGTVHGFDMHIRTRSKGERLVRLSATTLSASNEGTMLSILNDITPRPAKKDRGRRVGRVP